MNIWRAEDDGRKGSGGAVYVQRDQTNTAILSSGERVKLDYELSPSMDVALAIEWAHLGGD